MSGKRQKDPALLQDRRAGRVGALTAPSVAPEPIPVPIPPKGLLKSTRALWRDFFASPVAGAVDLKSDAHLLRRWILAIDEFERVFPVFQVDRVTTGSTGQAVMSPLAAYLKDLRAEIRRCEETLGAGPLARMRLGIAIGTAKLTAYELNRKLDAPLAPRGPEQTTDDPDDWEDA